MDRRRWATASLRLMPWARQDDSFYDHRKVRAMPLAVRNAACGLYWRAVALCNRHLTDGWLTDEDLVLIDGKPQEVSALVAVNLFDRRKRGLRIHDFLVFNKSRVQVLAERETKAAAGRLGGIASGKRRQSKPEAPASRLVEPPSRPVPSPVASNEAPPPNPQADAFDIYQRVTGSWPSQKVTPWLSKLVDEHGEERVCDALIAVSGQEPDPSTLLSRTRDHLAAEAHRMTREAEDARQRADDEDERREQERIEAMTPEQRTAARERFQREVAPIFGGLVKDMP